MNAPATNIRAKKVPTLYEQDESKYAGPHRWQVQTWAVFARRLLRRYAYTRWSDQSFSSVSIDGMAHLEDLGNRPAVFVANHQSHLDTLLTQAALPEAIKRRLYYGAAQDRWFVKGKKKLTLKPWYQSLALGTFPILRGGGQRALSYADWLLKQGNSVFLFPEGTRATDGNLGAFKHGAAILAVNNQVPIVPLYLDGLAALRPKGQKESRRGPARLTAFEPLVVSKDSDVEATTQGVFDVLNRHHLSVRGEVLTNNLSDAA